MGNDVKRKGSWEETLLMLIAPGEVFRIPSVEDKEGRPLEFTRDDSMEFQLNDRGKVREIPEELRHLFDDESIYVTVFSDSED